LRNAFAQHALSARRVFPFARDEQYAAMTFFLLLREELIDGHARVLEWHAVQVEVCRDCEFALFESRESLATDARRTRAHVKIFVRDVETFSASHRGDLFLTPRFDVRQIGGTPNANAG